MSTMLLRPGSRSSSCHESIFQACDDVAFGDHLGPARQVGDGCCQLRGIVAGQDFDGKRRVVEASDANLEATVTEQP